MTLDHEGGDPRDSEGDDDSAMATGRLGNQTTPMDLSASTSSLLQSSCGRMFSPWSHQGVGPH